MAGMPLKRKQSSGYQNRKNQKKRLASTKSPADSFDKFLIRNQPIVGNATNEDDATADKGMNEGNGIADNGMNEGNVSDGAADNGIEDDNVNVGVSNNGVNEGINGNVNVGVADNGVNDNENYGSAANSMNDGGYEVNNENEGVDGDNRDRNEDDVNTTTENNEVENCGDKLTDRDMLDPGNWETIDKKLVDFLVENGPVRVDNIIFPRDDKNDCFSSYHYFRKLSNFEKQDRRWLVYSKTLDKVFCFCCKLFMKRESNYQLCSTGFNDWNNLSGRLASHENCGVQHRCMYDWLELELRLRKEKTIDKRIQEQINKERKHYKEVLKRMKDGVFFLAKNGLALRGDNEKVYTKNNGNFLSFIKTLGKYDPVLKYHLDSIEKNEMRTHYLSHKIQNELISMLVDSTRKLIVKKIHEAKYFSVILDCTPDVSRREQMSIIIRCVDVSTARIEEYYLGFLRVEDKIGEGLFFELEDALINLGLNIDDIRGQGYDNGANMKGKHKGVQARLLEINPRAFYTPCACHSLNLILSDMAKSCPKASYFFGSIQRIYTLFSASTNRWDVFKEEIGKKGWTLKPLSDTRWEIRVASVKAIRYQAPKIRNDLERLRDSSPISQEVSTADSLVSFDLHNFEFYLSLTIWYRLLFAVNTVSKSLQSKDMDIGVAIQQTKGLIEFFKDFRVNGFQKAMDEAKEIARAMGTEPTFREVRTIRTTEPTSGEEFFRKNYFLYIVDSAMSSFRTRFEQFQMYEEIFWFLYDLNKLKYMSEDELMSACVALEAYLKHGRSSDIDGRELCMELIVMRIVLPSSCSKPIDVLQFLLRMGGCYPNAWIAYRILLTIPVTVASAERSFSNLKLIFSYLRSTTSQERLVGLSMLAIENDMAMQVDFKIVLSDFASRNVRRVIFE
ncbi:zinc finger MYM-type protein 1-like [Papaver somniferum]|uniref:zinc finger MYM-type protein 1-like n=1 Tax=Papaver somniferum TaxID=3469 RepID=UPI000E6FE3EA|nr:zinc finger MYM-type protein 1-like [Papaver somniferum]